MCKHHGCELELRVPKVAEWQHDRATGAADREGGDIQQSNGAGNRERSLVVNIQAAPVREPSAIPGASENGDHRILPQRDNTGREANADSLIIIPQIFKHRSQTTVIFYFVLGPVVS